MFFSTPEVDYGLNGLAVRQHIFTYCYGSLNEEHNERRSYDCPDGIKKKKKRKGTHEIQNCRTEYKIIWNDYGIKSNRKYNKMMEQMGKKEIEEKTEFNK